MATVMRWALFYTLCRYYFCHVSKIPNSFLQSLQCYWLRRLKDRIKDWFGIFPMLCLAQQQRKKKRFAIQSSQDVVWVPKQPCLHKISHKHSLALFYTLFKLVSRKKIHFSSLYIYFFYIIQFHEVMQIKGFICMNA